MGEIETIFNMDIRNGLLFIAALIIAAIWIIQKWDWIVGRFGIKTKTMMEEERQDKKIDTLEEHMKKTDSNMTSLVESIAVLQTSVQEVSSQVHAMQKKNDENEAARLKDRIAQAYRTYHVKMELTAMEKEALEELIKAYSQYSDNSFVHSVVEKELPQWRVIEE